MDRNRILKVAAHIDALTANRFTMGRWMGGYGEMIDEYDLRKECKRTANECGTPACIAGHTVLLFGDTLLSNPHMFIGGDSELIETMAKQLLELTDAQAHRLFMPGFGVMYADDAQSWAVRTLRKLADTGEVEW